MALLIGIDQSGNEHIIDGGNVASFVTPGNGEIILIDTNGNIHGAFRLNDDTNTTITIPTGNGGATLSTWHLTTGSLNSTIGGSTTIDPNDCDLITGAAVLPTEGNLIFDPPGNLGVINSAGGAITITRPGTGSGGGSGSFTNPPSF